ncbi:MAG: hypothetical protein CMJ62_02145 [Planctomycetaceae bacterium]|nr:hypothetical protein [Planctomycetaceae bacterium]
MAARRVRRSRKFDGAPTPFPASCSFSPVVGSSVDDGAKLGVALQDLLQSVQREDNIPEIQWYC